MREIKIKTDSPYSVLVGNGLLKSAGKQLRKLTAPCKVLLITDSNVKPLYESTVCGSLTAEGFSVVCFTFTAGEASKNISTLTDILNTLAESCFTRTDFVAGLGGGVVGDIAGFAASVYLRGIRYINLPTTVLAAVDSSVGGKTAVDLPSGKNLVGSFWQPSLVLCDTDTHKTLSKEYFSDGFGEIIKYALLDGSMLQLLNSKAPYEDIIINCIKIKADIVEKDERESKLRKLLNLGHTAGHAIELCSDYTVSHGKAVAAGMVIATKYAVKKGICTPEVLNELLRLLDRYELPSSYPFSADELLSAVMHDKKMLRNGIDVILPEGEGSCIIYRIEQEEIKSFLSGGTA